MVKKNIFSTFMPYLNAGNTGNIKGLWLKLAIILSNNISAIMK